MAKRTFTLDTKEIKLIVDSIQDEHVALAKKLSSICRTIKVSSAKAKGRRLQQKVCTDISALIKIPYDSRVDGLIASRGMGQPGIDVMLLGEARTKFPFSIECKACESLDLLGAITQAKNNLAPGTDWMVVTDRKTFEEPVVVMSWEVFLKVMAGEIPAKG